MVDLARPLNVLAAQIRAMSVTKCQQVVQDNLGLAASCAIRRYEWKRKVKCCQPIKDTEEWSVAVTGLVKAAWTYRTETGWKFSTYAYACIRNEFSSYEGSLFRHNVPASSFTDLKCDPVSGMSRDPWERLEAEDHGRECAALLAGVMELLPEEWCKVLRLRQRGLTFERISIRLRITKGTAINRYKSAIGFLRRWFCNEG